MRRSKFGNVPTRSVHTGRMFQSKLEASREPVLLALSNSNQIQDLEYQTPFRIDLFGTTEVKGLLMALLENGSVSAEIRKAADEVSRSYRNVCTYRADFTYREGGKLVVEDTKGYRTPEYALKKKLMEVAFNIEIQEPSMGGVQQRARGAGVKGRGTGSRLKGGR